MLKSQRLQLGKDECIDGVANPSLLLYFWLLWLLRLDIGPMLADTSRRKLSPIIDPVLDGRRFLCRQGGKAHWHAGQAALAQNSLQKGTLGRLTRHEKRSAGATLLHASSGIKPQLAHLAISAMTLNTVRPKNRRNILREVRFLLRSLRGRWTRHQHHPRHRRHPNQSHPAHCHIHGWYHAQSKTCVCSGRFKARNMTAPA